MEDSFMSNAYIVLAITLFMIVMFLTNKVPYGVATMTCCALFVITGVFSVPEAFSGLSNKTTILVAGVFAVASAFGKTSLIKKIRQQMQKLKDKNGFVLILFIVLISIFLSQLMGRVAVITLMALFLQSLNAEDDISPSRMIMVVLAIIAVWSLKFPIGLGATWVPTINAQYEGIISNPDLMLNPMDMLKVVLIPGVVITAYTLFAWRLIPNNVMNTEHVKEAQNQAVLSKRDEVIINIVFAIVMVSFVLGKYLGTILYVIPVIGVLVLIYTKVMTPKEANAAVTADMVWMVAGVLVVSDAIGKSGAGNLIGELILKILGQNPNSIVTLAVFTMASIIMTTFMSNTGTAAVLTPIAASTALVSGVDPRGMILAVNIASVMAIAFPSGSAECALTFAIGNHNPVKLLKFTIPYLIVATISIVFSVHLFFPVH